MTSSEQIESIERVVRLRSRRAAISAAGTAGAAARTGEDAVRSSVGAQAALDLGATTAMMVMMTLDTTELLNRGLLEIRKSLLSR